MTGKRQRLSVFRFPQQQKVRHKIRLYTLAV